MTNDVHRLQQLKIATMETPAGPLVALLTNEVTYSWLAGEIPTIVEGRHGPHHQRPTPLGLQNAAPRGSAHGRQV
jgi:hypothetical protein